MNKQIRRWVCIALSVVTLVFTSCSHAEPEPVKKSTELELWHYCDTSYIRDTLIEYVDSFNRMDNGIEIKIRYIPDEDYRKQLALSIADDQAPDLALVDSADFMSINEMQEFADLSDVIPDLEQYILFSLKPCKIGERVLGFPAGVNCLAFYCNMDILNAENLEVPKNWDEFYDVAIKLSQSKNINSYGCSFPSLQSEESTYDFLPVLWSMGGLMEDVTSEESRNAFRYLKRLIDSGAMNKKASEMTQTDITKEFEKGNIAMIFASTMAGQEMIRNNPKLHFTRQTLPGTDRSYSVVGGEILGVLSKDHTEEAEEFIKYMSQESSINDFTIKTGYLPARKDILEKQYQESEDVREKVGILKTAETRSITPDWPEISLQLSMSLNRIMMGADVNQETEHLSQNIREIVSK